MYRNFYSSKHSDFFRCKKCYKAYNYIDVKDKDKIYPKCGGELQDYKEFEKEEQRIQWMIKVKNFITIVEI